MYHHFLWWVRSVVITEAILLILVKEMVAVCGENAQRVNTVCGQDAEFSIVKAGVKLPHSTSGCDPYLQKVAVWWCEFLTENVSPLLGKPIT
jgi:hypothetical protein